MSTITYKSDKVRTLVAVGVFSAFAYVCCVLFHFKAAFLSFDLKDSVMTVGAMLFGPVYGLAMSLIVSLIELVTISGTGLYGFVMNFLSSSVFVAVGSFIYSKKRTMNGAILGMAASVVSMTAVMMLANLLITPFYMHVTVSDVVALIPTLLLPFNLTKAVFNASIVFMIYNPISKAIRSAGFKSYSKSGEHHAGAKNIPTYVVVIVAAVVATAALLYFFFGLHGSFTAGSIPNA